MALEQRIPSPLTVRFTYTGTVADGDWLALADDGTVHKLVDPAEPYVGQVYAFETEIKECTVVVPYTYRRDTRIAGEAVVPGFLARGPNNTALQYTPAAVASVVGTTVGPKTVTVDTDDVIKLTLENGTDQSIQITAGTDLTFAAIAAEVNATLVGMALFVDATGHMGVKAKEVGKAITIGAVTHDAYTLLGWTAGVVAPTNASHDPSMCGGLILGTAAQGSAVNTLEY